MSQPIICFDLDGTLVDTAPDLLDSLNHSLGAGGAPLADATSFRSFVGHGGRVMIERAYAASRRKLDLEEHEHVAPIGLERIERAPQPRFGSPRVHFVRLRRGELGVRWCFGRPFAAYARAPPVVGGDAQANSVKPALE